MEQDDLIAEQIRYYRGRAPEYDRTSRPPGDPFAMQGEMLEDALHAFAPAGRVVEIACGTGSWTRILATHEVSITALDSSPEMIELNRERLGDPRIRYIVADVFDWTSDERYDVVFFANWLSHVPPDRFEDFWSTVDNCLAPGGRIFLVDELEDAWRFEESLNEEFSPEASHIVIRRLRDGSAFRAVKIFWNPDELQKRLFELGWDIDVHPTGAFFWAEGTRRG